MSEPATAIVRLEDYDTSKFNVLHPVVRVNDQARSPVLVESLSLVQITPDPIRGEVYNDFRYANERDGKFALSGLALNKIAQAAGIKWDIDRCRMVRWQTDPVTGHITAEYMAVGGIRQPNGEWQIEPATKVIDTAVEAEDLEETYKRKLKAGRGKFTEDDIPDMVRREILQLKRFLSGHVETKAKLRVIRALLSMKQVYTSAELQRPFVVPRLLYRPDLADPREHERVQLEGARAVRELYGGSGPSPMIGAASEVPASPDDTSAPAAVEGGEVVGASSPQPDENVTAPSSDATPAAGTGAPELPKRNPTFTDGPHQGKTFEEVTADYPEYMRALIDNAGRKEIRELAKAWYDAYYPSLPDA